jgi:hypothetical protein
MVLPEAEMGIREVRETHPLIWRERVRADWAHSAAGGGGTSSSQKPARRCAASTSTTK